jgi:hypothetical protein
MKCIKEDSELLIHSHHNHNQKAVNAKPEKNQPNATEQSNDDEKNIIYAKCINIVMHKTQHRRRHRHRRTRRGGAHSTAHAAHAASAPAALAGPATPSPQMQAILAKVRAYAATTPAPSSRKVKGISKSQASQKRFEGILNGKIKQSNKSAFKGPVISDPQAARERKYL